MGATAQSAVSFNDPVGKVDDTGEEPGDNAARASMAVVYGANVAADQKNEDAKAAKNHGGKVAIAVAVIFIGGVVLPELAMAAMARAPMAARVTVAAAGAQPARPFGRRSNRLPSR